MDSSPADTVTRPLRVSPKLLVLLLAVAAASVDAVIYLAFGVLTATQTGNTIILGAAIAHGRFDTAARSTASIVGYISGAALGELVLVRRPRSEPPRTKIGRALVAELVLLGVLVIVWHVTGTTPDQATAVLLVAMAATAMGIQSTTVILVYGAPSTTAMSRPLTDFATGVVQWLRPAETPPIRSAERDDLGSSGSPFGQGPWLYGITWLTYLIGAIAGALLYGRIGALTLLLSVALIAMVVVAIRDR
jgi:uncharacterized membrane protein YoaK (UPF0700 family)